MEHVLEDLCHLRNFKFTDKTPEKIYELNIRKRNLHCEINFYFQQRSGG